VANSAIIGARLDGDATNVVCVAFSLRIGHAVTMNA
jgi:hypothetical protein